ncbi:MipA/OmpV family protein [Enterobacter asburiae]|uniref:MipA/OmpV family protein n=1 Tax=Enterobacter asburiae TaxID=61645 RepID=UPI003F57DDE4
MMTKNNVSPREHLRVTAAFFALAALMSASHAVRAAELSTPLKGPSLSLGAGMAVAPVYEGSSAYTLTPLPLVKAVAPTQDWGTFTASFPEGLRWDLPVGDLFGVALLGSYDPGRKENIRTLSGHNHHLRGMGNLDGTTQAGVELSVNYAPYRLFVRGMQALESRRYGGEDLGHTAYADVGLGSEIPLSGSLGMSLETYATWSDRHDMMARFGVTPEQAARSGFHAHRAGGGLRGVTMQWGLDWAYSPQWSYSGGVRLMTLSSNAARNSPLTEKTTSAALFLNGMYTF